MSWWQALLLGLVQGLTEFLPVSSSGHLRLVQELTGTAVDADAFLGFTVLVHVATVCSTLVVFWAAIWKLLKGLFKFRYNDETDYICKLLVSAIPVAIVGFLFKDYVESLFGNGLWVVGIFLLVTALLLVFSDIASGKKGWVKPNHHRNGISYGQALVVGVGQSLAVAPGLSRSGTTIATGLMTGVKREAMAQFSFLMVLIPIVGEQLLEVVKSVSHGTPLFDPEVGAVALIIGFLAAFISGLFACKVMIAMVKKAKLSWFALYCAIVAALIFILA